MSRYQRLARLIALVCVPLLNNHRNENKRLEQRGIRQSLLFDQSAVSVPAELLMISLRCYLCRSTSAAVSACKHTHKNFLRGWQRLRGLISAERQDEILKVSESRLTKQPSFTLKSGPFGLKDKCLWSFAQ